MPQVVKGIVESTQLVVQERISDRIVEQVKLVPQGREEIVEVVKNPVQQRFLGETRELIMHASVPQVDEQTFEVPEMQSRDRFPLVLHVCQIVSVRVDRVVALVFFQTKKCEQRFDVHISHKGRRCQASPLIVSLEQCRRVRKCHTPLPQRCKL